MIWRILSFILSVSIAVVPYTKWKNRIPLAVLFLIASNLAIQFFLLPPRNVSFDDLTSDLIKSGQVAHYYELGKKEEKRANDFLGHIKEGRIALNLQFKQSTHASIAYYKKALEANPKTSERAGLFYEIGIAYNAIAEWDSAESSWTKSLEYSRELMNDSAFSIFAKSLCANILNNMGQIYRARGEIKNALESHAESLALFNVLNDRKGLAVANLNLAFIYRVTGDPDSAIVLVEAALAYFDSTGMLGHMADGYGLLGEIYLAKHMFGDARDKFQRETEFAERQYQKAIIAASYHHWGSYYLAICQFDSVLMMLKGALRIDQELGDEVGVADDWGNIALAYRYLGNPEKAEEATKISLRINESIKRIPDAAIDCFNLGLLFMELKNYQEARNWFLKAGDYFMRTNAASQFAETEDKIRSIDSLLIASGN